MQADQGMMIWKLVQQSIESVQFGGSEAPVLPPGDGGIEHDNLPVSEPPCTKDVNVFGHEFAPDLVGNIMVAGKAKNRKAGILKQGVYSLVRLRFAFIGQIAGRQNRVGGVNAKCLIKHRGQGGVCIDTTQARRAIARQVAVSELNQGDCIGAMVYSSRSP